MKSNHLIIILAFAISVLLGYLLVQRMGWIKNSGIFVTSGDNEGVAIHVDRKLIGTKSACETYQFIELQFVGNLGENLRIVTKCTLTADGKNIDSFTIPFRHIFTFPPQTGEFTTKSETKVYVSNPNVTSSSKWSSKWKLISFHFANSSQDRFEIKDKKLILDTESVLDAAAGVR